MVLFFGLVFSVGPPSPNFFLPTPLLASPKNIRSLIACLHDQNKSGFFGEPAFIQPIRAIEKVFKKL